MDDVPNPFEESEADQRGDEGIGVARWSSLEEHARREALFEVVPGIELAEIAGAMERDEVERVQGWLGSGALTRVEGQRLESLRGHPRFEVRVVAPFVLCRPLA